MIWITLQILVTNLKLQPTKQPFPFAARWPWRDQTGEGTGEGTPFCTSMFNKQMHFTIRVSLSDCQSPSLWFWVGLLEAGVVSENQHNTPPTTSEPPWTLLNCYTVKIKATLKTWLSPFITLAVCIHAFPLSHLSHCTFQKQAQAVSLSNSEELDHEDQAHCAEYHQLIPFWQGNISFTEELLYPRNTPASWGRERRNYRQKAGKYSPVFPLTPAIHQITWKTNPPLPSSLWSLPYPYTGYWGNIYVINLDMQSRNGSLTAWTLDVLCSRWKCLPSKTSNG